MNNLRQNLSKKSIRPEQKKFHRLEEQWVHSNTTYLLYIGKFEIMITSRKTFWSNLLRKCTLIWIILNGRLGMKWSDPDREHKHVTSSCRLSGRVCACLCVDWRQVIVLREGFTLQMIVTDSAYICKLMVSYVIIFEHKAWGSPSN